jgi:hypothetical protein
MESQNAGHGTRTTRRHGSGLLFDLGTLWGRDKIDFVLSLFDQYSFIKRETLPLWHTFTHRVLLLLWTYRTISLARTHTERGAANLILTTTRYTSDPLLRRRRLVLPGRFPPLQSRGHSPYCLGPATQKLHRPRIVVSSQATTTGFCVRY